MALIIKDRVKETTTTTGTGTITLAGASTGFRSFADIGNANTTYYCISGGSQFEVGLGTYTLSGTTLARTTVLSNSLGTTALIDFSAGTKDVFCTYPSAYALLGSSQSVTSTGTGSVVLSTASTITGGATINATSQDIIIGGTSATGNINIGTGVPNKIINIGATAGGDVGIYASTYGGVNNNAYNTINIGNASSAYVNIGFEDGATIVNILGAVYIGALGELTSIGGSLSVNTSIVCTSITGSSTLSGFTSLSSTASASLGTSQTTVAISIGGASGTGGITLGQSTQTQAIGIATGVAASGRTKTVNIGTSSAAGSTTSIAIGSTLGTSTTTVNGLLKQQTKTVATLPTGSAGARSFVSDALAPAFGATVTGGGAVGIPVYHDGTSWKVG